MHYKKIPNQITDWGFSLLHYEPNNICPSSSCFTSTRFGPAGIAIGGVIGGIIGAVGGEAVDSYLVEITIE